jgi:acetyl-CoA carboxylase carboxyl transferase subunit beta
VANWIQNVVRPKIRNLWTKRETPDNLWVKCPETGEMVFHKDLEANQFVFPNSGYHQRIDARTRFRLFFDGGDYDKLPLPQVPLDPLKFRDERRYTERLKAAKAKTGLEDAVMVGTGTVEGVPLVAAVQDFDFMGGSLGMAAGDAIITGAKAAVERKNPYVLFAGSGGARMQEGILSLMQMAKTSAMLAKLAEAGLPHVSILTHPTTGGVTASFASLGDVILAEPKALIGFAGPRVIRETINQELPEGFQRSEFLEAHGFVDRVVPRRELRETLASVLAFFGDAPMPVGLHPRRRRDD